MKNIKNEILNRSDMFNHYKNLSEALAKENKKLKKESANSLKYKNTIASFFEDGEEDIVNYCPICGNISEFKTSGVVKKREKAQCPFCKSMERERFSYYFLRRFSYIFDKPCKILHFAPEIIFYNYFSSNPNADYYPVDMFPETYEKRNLKIRDKVNMENIIYEDSTFDFIYNSHVLEHVPDDIKAMGELYRVLKDDGVCMIMVPLYNIPETFENEEYNTPELRLKYFGQEDHVRKYGLDFSDRLKSVGFNVDEIKPEDIFDEDRIKIMSLLKNEKIYICTK